MKKLCLLAASAAVVLPLVAVPAFAASGPNELIPRKVIFGNPEKVTPLVSPDGSMIAFSAPLNGVMNVWVAPANNLGAARAVTKDTVRPIRTYQWALNGTHLLYLQDQGGDENFHVFAVDIAKNTTKDLTAFPKTRAEIIATSYKRPDEVLLGVNNRDERWHDAWIINVVTGEAKLVQKNEGFSGFVADSTLTVRLGAKPTPDGGQELLKLEGEQWKPFTRIPGEDGLTTEPLFFSGDDRSIFMLDSRGRDKGVLAAINVDTGAASVVGQSQKSDVADIIADQVTNKVLAYAAEYERTEWTVLDPALNADFSFLKQQISGEWNLLSQSKDNNLWTLRIDNVVEPVKFALYNRKARSLSTLFTASITVAF